MKLHIFVATTQGLVAIQNITAIDDADISSIVSINGTSTTANISSAYHNFVRKGAGIIQQDFGACSYRINISQRIDQGNSWQLAFYLAHAANNENMLGDGQVNVGDQVICATGEINTSSRDIQAISKIILKQQLAAKQIKQWHKQNINVAFLVPYANAQTLDKKLPLNIKLVRNLTHALSYLPLADSKALVNSADLTSMPSPATGKTIAESSYSIKKMALMALALFLLIFLSINYWFSTDKAPLENTSKELHTQKNSQSNDQSLIQSNVQNINQSVWQVILLNSLDNIVNKTLQPAYALIEKTITEQLIAENFDIADKTLLNSTSKLTEQTYSQLSKHGINLAIRFNLSVNKLDQLTSKNNTSAEVWRYELSAYLIDLATKRKIETHTEYGEFSASPSKLIHCDKQCFSQWHATNARKLAQDMGAILVIKLNNLPRRYQFNLTFQNFLAKELTMIEKRLKGMSGFLSNTLLQEFDAKSSLLHQTSSRNYSYYSYLSADELTNNLSKIFEQSGVSVIQRNNNANTLVFIRYNMPYFFYYVFSVIMLTALLFLLFILQRSGRFTLTSENKPNDLHAKSTKNVEPPENNNNHAQIDQKAEPKTEQNPQAIKGTVIGLGALKNHYIFTSNNLALGRLADEPTTSFTIGYQQISRVGKQCLFSYENNNFYITEQGSTNGNILNNRPLATQQKTHIKQDSQLILGGTNEADIAICQLALKVTPQPSTALIMQLNNNNHQFIDVKDITLSWPSMAKDLCSRWILLATEVSLGIDNDQIKLGCDKRDVIAYLVYQNGFYIRPAEITDESRQVMIDDNVIHSQMPICEHAVISLNGYEFSLQTPST